MSSLSPRAAHLPAGPFYRLLVEARRRARERGEPVLVSSTQPIATLDPLAIFATAPAGATRVYWQHQDEREPGSPLRAIAGAGAAHTLAAAGSDRFQAVAREWRNLLAHAVVAGGKRGMRAWGAGPLALGGFSFDPTRPRTTTWKGFADARFTVPRFAVATSAGGSWLTTNVLVAPDAGIDDLAATIARERRVLLTRARRYAAQPHEQLTAMAPDAYPESVDAMPAREWQRVVARTARDVRDGRFDKVVLARQSRVAAPGAPFEAADVLARLRRTFPGSFVFAFSHPDQAGDRTFLGATPERLVRLHDREVETSSLAGSIRRGATAAEDERLGQDLLRNAKERTEHAVVASMLYEALAPLCRELSTPAEPTLLRLANVQHLFTPIRGRLANGQTILDLVERLHPTPAVGGYPRAAALAAIREREQLDRGWYAGPVGWLDDRGEGEFAVALRSALLDAARREALLFAGCGIVGDSQAEKEYAESRLKMQAMRSALL